MTQPWTDLANSDCMFVIGANPAANHPITFKYINEAKIKGAKLIVADPKFSETASKADIYAPFRSGTDIALIGGIIKYVLDDIEKNPENYNLTYLSEYTNAPYLVNADFKGPDDLDGLFSGYTAEGYDKSTWQFQTGEDRIIKQDKSLKDPNCVFQLLKKHFERYSPEMVSSITGTPIDIINDICRAFAATGRKEKAGALIFSMGSTQHTHGAQNISSYSILQLLLGNIGMSGGGIIPLRGLSAVSGAVDMGYYAGALPGNTLPFDTDNSLDEYLERVTPVSNDPQSLNWSSNKSKYFISLLKAWYGEAAQKDNMFGYHYLPKVSPSEDYSMIAIIEAMIAGEIKGFMSWAQNWAVTGPNTNRILEGMDNLDWLVADDIFHTDTTDFWHRPGVNPADIKTEVFLLPGLSSLEKEGSISSGHRWLQWRWKVADGPQKARSELWIVNKIALKLQELYTQEGGPNCEAITKLAWNYGDNPDPHQVAKEVNGYDLATGKLIENYTKLKNDGTTSCGLWFYSGIYTEKGNMMARRDPTPNPENNALHQNWGYCWPLGRNIIYNRASVDLDGKPWDKERPVILWSDGEWVGDVPDGPGAPMAEGGYKPFIMKPDGVAKIFSNGLADGPFPEHYEPWESPVDNGLSKQQNTPLLKVYRHDERCDRDQYPIICTINRHVSSVWSSGSVTRNSAWLVELQSEPFVEMSEELAGIIGIANGDRVIIENKRGKISMAAMVTKRYKPFDIAGETVYQVGIPWHWGHVGMATGDVANKLCSFACDANIMQPEQRVFLVNVRKA